MERARLEQGQMLMQARRGSKARLTGKHERRHAQREARAMMESARLANCIFTAVPDWIRQFSIQGVAALLFRVN